MYDLRYTFKYFMKIIIYVKYSMNNLRFSCFH